MSEEQTLLTQGAAPVEAAPAAAPAAPQDAPAAPQEPQDWRPESLRGEKWLEKYKSPEEALKGFAEAQKMLGKKADPLAPPAEDAPQEEKDAFNAKLLSLLGVPDAPEKVAEAYTVEVPEDAPEGYAPNEGLVSMFQDVFFKAGAPPAVFKQVSKAYVEAEIASINAARAESKANQEKAEAALVKSWQAEGRVPKEEFTKALQSAQILGLVGKDGKDNLLGHLGNSTQLVAALANAHGVLSEAGLKGGGTVSAQPAYTPKEALNKLQGMQRDPRYRGENKDPDFVREVDAFAERYGDLIVKLSSR